MQKNKTKRACKDCCGSCPVHTGQPSQQAIDALHYIQANKKAIDHNEIDRLCPWFINSAEHHYCFWILHKELHGSPLTDKEICSMLSITKDELEVIYKSAIQKLKDNKDTPEIREFIQEVFEKSLNSNEDNTVFMPDAFNEKISEIDQAVAEQIEEEEKDKPKRGRPKKGFGMPMHRDGKKVDLFSLSTKYRRKKT